MSVFNLVLTQDKQARILESDLEKVKLPTLNGLLRWIPGAQISSDVAELIATINVRRAAAEQTKLKPPLYKVEAMMIERLKAGLSQKNYKTGIDAWDLLAHSDPTARFTENGLTSVTESPKPAQWVLPEQTSFTRVGVQWLLGVTISLFKREERGVSPIEMSTFMSKYNIQGFDSAQASALQLVLQVSLDAHFSGRKTTGPGREYIRELFVFFTELPLDEYLLLQRQMCLTVFSPCFELGWTDGTNVTQKKMSSKNRRTILRILPEYKVSFSLVSEKSGEGLRKKIKDANGLLYVMTGPLPTAKTVKYKIPQDFFFPYSTIVGQPFI